MRIRSATLSDSSVLEIKQYIMHCLRAVPLAVRSDLHACFQRQIIARTSGTTYHVFGCLRAQPDSARALIKSPSMFGCRYVTNKQGLYCIVRVQSKSNLAIYACIHSPAPHPRGHVYLISQAAAASQALGIYRYRLLCYYSATAS